MIENFGHALGGMAQDRGRARLQALVDRRHGIKSPDELLAELAEWKAAYADVASKFEASKIQSIVNAAGFDGSQEQVNALKEALAAIAPNHPILQMSTQKYVDGRPKSKLRLLFEAAFDKRMRSNDMDPFKHRKN